MSSKREIQKERSGSLTVDLKDLVGRLYDTMSCPGEPEAEADSGLAMHPPIWPGQSLSESEGQCVYN